MTIRHLGDQTLADRTPPPDRGHVRLRPGFVNKNKASGINFVLTLLPLQASSRDVRPILLAGAQTFFNAETGAVNDVPDSKIAHRDPTALQLSPQRTQRQIRLLRDPFDNPVALAGQYKWPMTTQP